MTDDSEKTAKDMDRAKEISRRRHRSKESETSRQSSASSESLTSSESSGSSVSKTSKSEGRPEDEAVSERTNHSFYLRDDLKLAIRREVTPALLDFEETYGADLSDTKHRNRHYRPLLLLLGARALGDLDPEKIHELLETEDVLDDIQEFL